jgi:predicted RNA-binding Zn-ribbon protein involved in translation (DUF1610 family)
MKQLTKEEFHDRVEAVQRARHIFSNLTEGNINKSFQAYQDIFAERERAIFLSTTVLGHRMRTVMDKYNRPKCPECGQDMMFRVLTENKEGIKVQLVCQNAGCDTVLNSTESLEWWQEQLRIKNESEGTNSKVTEGKQEG